MRKGKNGAEIVGVAIIILIYQSHAAQLTIVVQRTELRRW